MTSERIRNQVTTVLDAGARYGKHPSWSRFDAPLSYFAFEPDAEEADRLKARSAGASDYHVIPAALSDRVGPHKLHLTTHRGYSSFLEPDLNSDWFKYCRPGEAGIERVIEVPAITVDQFCRDKQVRFDFMKLDTEGTEYEVLLGAKEQITSHTMGIRCEVSFQRCYKDMALFGKIHDLLLDHGFMLLNLDYFGRGIPRVNLVRSPDPSSPDQSRFGTLVATDAVWVKETEFVENLLRARKWENDVQVFKYAYFCFLNNCPDMALDALLRWSGHLNTEDRSAYSELELYLRLRKFALEFLGRYRVYPDHTWKHLQKVGEKIFQIKLEGGNKYWEMLQEL